MKDTNLAAAASHDVGDMKKILVSQCLYGEKIVRYDADEKVLEDPIFLKWKEEGRLLRNLDNREMTEHSAPWASQLFRSLHLCTSNWHRQKSCK